MTRLVVRPLAEADLDEAFAWYESRSISLDVDSLRADDHRVEILACSHTSLHPRCWQRRA